MSRLVSGPAIAIVALLSTTPFASAALTWSDLLIELEMRGKDLANGDDVVLAIDQPTPTFGPFGELSVSYSGCPWDQTTPDYGTVSGNFVPNNFTMTHTVNGSGDIECYDPELDPNDNYIGDADGDSFVRVQAKLNTTVPLPIRLSIAPPATFPDGTLLDYSSNKAYIVPPDGDEPAFESNALAYVENYGDLGGFPGGEYYAYDSDFNLVDQSTTGVSVEVELPPGEYYLVMNMSTEVAMGTGGFSSATTTLELLPEPAALLLFLTAGAASFTRRARR